jgi:hypothetical protein
MRIILAKMLWNFDFSLAEPERNWAAEKKAYGAWEHRDLKIRLVPVVR